MRADRHHCNGQSLIYRINNQYHHTAKDIGSAKQQVAGAPCGLASLFATANARKLELVRLRSQGLIEGYAKEPLTLYHYHGIIQA